MVIRRIKGMVRQGSNLLPLLSEYSLLRRLPNSPNSRLWKYLSCSSIWERGKWDLASHHLKHEPWHDFGPLTKILQHKVPSNSGLKCHFLQRSRTIVSLLRQINSEFVPKLKARGCGTNGWINYVQADYCYIRPPCLCSVWEYSRTSLPRKLYPEKTYVQLRFRLSQLEI